MSKKDLKNTKNNVKKSKDIDLDIQEKENVISANELKDENENQKEKPENEKSFESDEINEKLNIEIEELRNEKLRLLAEMENLRKRADKEKIDSLRYGSFNFAKDILSIDDNLSRALEVIPKEEKNFKSLNDLIDGLKMVQREFANVLEKHGIKKIDALKQKFDHNYHQAMIEIDSEVEEEGLVIQEMQSGFTMHERLLRPTLVGVSKKPQSGKKEEKKD